MSEGVKFDVGKDPWQLMPWDAVRGIVKVLAFGAKKYTRRYETPWHGLLSASFVKNVQVVTPSGSVVLVTRDTCGRQTLSMQSAKGRTAEIGKPEIPNVYASSHNCAEIARQLVSVMGEQSGWRSSESAVSQKRNTRKRWQRGVASAAQSVTLTLTIATTPDGSEVSFAANATTALECLETLWKDLSERFPTFAAHSLEIEGTGERNWEAGMDWSRPFAALQRHLVAWWNREGVDPETGYSHLWHAGCCVLFLIAFELRGVGRDDRPVLPAKEAT